MGQAACPGDITPAECKIPPIAYTELTQKQRACYWTVFYVMTTSRNASFEDATVSAVPKLLTKRRSFGGEPCLEATERDVGRRFFFFRTIFKRFFREMLKIIIHPPSVVTSTKWVIF
jgi:hypothetical protein